MLKLRARRTRLGCRATDEARQQRGSGSGRAPRQFEARIRQVTHVVADDIDRAAGRAAQLAQRRLERRVALPQPDVDPVDDVAQYCNKGGWLRQLEPPVDGPPKRAECAAVSTLHCAVKVGAILGVGPLHVCNDAKREERRRRRAGRGEWRPARSAGVQRRAAAERDREAPQSNRDHGGGR
eukprot:3999291-Prymnesium_polylepis.1